MIEELTDRYLKSYNDMPRENARNMFINYPQNVVFNDDMVIMFVNVSDDILLEIYNHPRIIGNESFIRMCYTQCGKNIYLLKAFGNACGFKRLIKTLIACHEPDSISFHRDDLNRVHSVYQRSLLCHGWQLQPQ